MQLIRTSAAIGLAALALAGCIPPAPEPTPAPTPTPTPSPVATQAPPLTMAPPPAPIPDQWLDLPQTSGDWRYEATAQGSVARFARAGSPSRLEIACALNAREVRIFLPASGNLANRTVEIRSQAIARSSMTAPRADGSGVELVVPASDALLDALAFSQGRFAIQLSGAEALYLPSWQEISRVVEDCRG